MSNKKFKSVDGTTKRLALMSGHVFLVGPEFCPLPAFAHSAAYANGCISEDMIYHKAVEEVVVNPNHPLALQETVIDDELVAEKAAGLELAKVEVYNFLKKAVEESIPGVFSKNNKVMPLVVNKKLGKDLPTTVIREQWAHLQNDMTE